MYPAENYVNENRNMVRTTMWT